MLYYEMRIQFPESDRFISSYSIQ